MRETDICILTTGLRRSVPFWRRRWSLVLIVVFGMSFALVACGSSGSIATLNTGKIERAIAQSSLAQRGRRAQVNCPSTVPQEQGFEFSCMAVVGSVGTRFVVVEKDENGHVRYEAP